MEPAVRWIAWLGLALASTPHARAEEVLYRLPMPEGSSHMFTQAPGGMISTHYTRESLHAVDIAMREDTPVLAARGGTVAATESRHGSNRDDDPLTDYGNFVRVRHEDGTIATYAHLRHAGVAVQAGEQVRTGQLLGYSGTTGFSSGPHLHFGVARLERNGDAQEEVSVPVRFYVGKPPLAFAPRAALIVTVNYASPAEPPRTPREPRPMVEWKPRVLTPEEELQAWAELGALFAFALAGLAWFYRFSRS